MLTVAAALPAKPIAAIALVAAAVEITDVAYESLRLFFGDVDLRQPRT